MEKELIALVRDIWIDEQKEIIALLDNAKELPLGSLGRVVVGNAETIKIPIKASGSQFLPKLSAMNIVWLGKMLPFIKELVIKIGGEKLSEVNVGGQIDITTPAMARFFNKELAEMVTGINTTTRNQLKKALAEGFELGEGIEQIKNRVRNIN